MINESGRREVMSMQSSSLSQSSQHQQHHIPKTNNHNNNNILMKQHTSLAADGRSSLGIDEIMSEDEARRRREQLNRRPSYRQILKDLETVGDKPMKRELDESLTDRNAQHLSHLNHNHSNGLGNLSNGADGSSPYGSPISTNNGGSAQLLRNRHDSGSESTSGMLLSGARLNMAPPSSLSRMMGNGGGGGEMSSQPQPQHLAPITAANPLISAAVAAAVGNSLNLSTSACDLISLKPPPSSCSTTPRDPLSAAVSAAAASSAFSQNNEMSDWKNLYNSNSNNSSAMTGGGGIGQANTPGSMTSLSDNDDNNRKRQVRLLKNREAAKECRRKKKEYVKCLENRVGVLENQNKALIEELKTLKELYCQKEKSDCAP